MRELFRLLGERERRTLAVLGAAAGVCLLAFVFAGLGLMRGFRRAEASVRTLSAELAKAEAARDAAVAEAQSWEQAAADLAKLETERFYDGAHEVRDLRLDLARVFREAGIGVSKIAYRHADLEKGRMRKIVAGFAFVGTYAGLKRFLAVVERSPRFLILERIDFLNTGAETGTLNLRIELAAYYAN